MASWQYFILVATVGASDAICSTSDCHAEAARDAALLQKSSIQSKTSVAIDGVLIPDIAGTWVHNEMSGAAHVTQRGYDVNITNQLATWSPARGIIQGAQLHFIAPVELAGEFADVSTDAIHVGGLTLTRADGLAMLELRRRAQSEHRGNLTLDTTIVAKCAYPADANGEQPNIRNDFGQLAFATKPGPFDKVVPCSPLGGHAMGVCHNQADEKPWCARYGFSKPLYDQASWGYCRLCRDEDLKVVNDVVRTDVVKEEYAASPLCVNNPGAMQPPVCTGDIDCGCGYSCILGQCRTPAWDIAEAKRSWSGKYIKGYSSNAAKEAAMERLMQKLQKYSDETDKRQVQSAQHLAIIEAMEQHRKDVLSDIAVLSIQVSDLMDRANELDSQRKTTEAGWARIAKAGAIERMGELLKILEKQNMEIADNRIVWKEQTKVLATRKEVLEGRMYMLQRDLEHQQDVESWLKSEDVDARLELEERKNAKEKKKANSPGAFVGFEMTDQRRLSEKVMDSPFPWGGQDNSFMYVDSLATIQAGMCGVDSVCVKLGASITAAVELTLYEDPETGMRVFTTSKTRVYAEADAEVSCGAQAQGCMLKLQATAGASIGQEVKLQRDLGNGVMLEAAGEVEAGVIAFAKAEVGCKFSSGCRIKTQAYAGAYAKASAYSRFGNEDIALQIGGSVMGGAAAGGGVDAQATCNARGTCTVGVEACLMAGVGLCGSFSVDFDPKVVENGINGAIDAYNGQFESMVGDLVYVPDMSKLEALSSWGDGLGRCLEFLDLGVPVCTDELMGCCQNYIMQGYGADCRDMTCVRGKPYYPGSLAQTAEAKRVVDPKNRSICQVAQDVEKAFDEGMHGFLTKLPEADELASVDPVKVEYFRLPNLETCEALKLLTNHSALPLSEASVKALVKTHLLRAASPWTAATRP